MSIDFRTLFEMEPLEDRRLLSAIPISHHPTPTRSKPTVHAVVVPLQTKKTAAVHTTAVKAKVAKTPKAPKAVHKVAVTKKKKCPKPRHSGGTTTLPTFAGDDSAFDGTSDTSISTDTAGIVDPTPPPTTTTNPSDDASSAGVDAGTAADCAASDVADE